MLLTVKQACTLNEGALNIRISDGIERVDEETQSIDDGRVQQALTMLAEGFSPSTPVTMQFRAQFPSGQDLIDFAGALDLSYAGDWKEVE